MISAVSFYIYMSDDFATSEVQKQLLPKGDYYYTWYINTSLFTIVYDLMCK